MTVFRVDVDRDEARVVPAPHDTFKVKVGVDKKSGHVRSLSAIAKECYGTYKLWPVIWKHNFFPTLADPNKVKKDMVLTLPRMSKITPLDRKYCERIWLRWERPVEAARLLGFWMDEEAEERGCMDRSGRPCEPIWMQWNKARKAK